MIQAINAFSPQATYRGKNQSKGAKAKSLSNVDIALINAGGVAVAAGGLGTMLARSQTSSWAHAGVLGLCASFLTMFFMTPQLINRTGLNKVASTQDTELVAKNNSAKFTDAIKEHLKPAKKLVQFRQQS
jgi:succinate dehydrogenase/fumarate reductase flavoprotein subunit